MKTPPEINPLVQGVHLPIIRAAIENVNPYSSPYNLLEIIEISERLPAQLAPLYNQEKTGQYQNDGDCQLKIKSIIVLENIRQPQDRKEYCGQ